MNKKLEESEKDSSMIEKTPERRKEIRKVSSSSTVCGTPPQEEKRKGQEDLGELISREEMRYKRKGYGIIAAAMIAISFFHLGPVIAKKWMMPWVLG